MNWFHSIKTWLRFLVLLNLAWWELSLVLWTLWYHRLLPKICLLLIWFLYVKETTLKDRKVLTIGGAKRVEGGGGSSGAACWWTCVCWCWWWCISVRRYGGGTIALSWEARNRLSNSLLRRSAWSETFSLVQWLLGTRKWTITK